MEDREGKHVLLFFILVAVLLFFCIPAINSSKFIHNLNQDRAIKAYLEKAQEFKGYRDEEGYIEETVVEIRDTPPEIYKKRGYRTVDVTITLKLSEAFENQSAGRQCQWMYTHREELREAAMALRKSTGYEQVLELERRGIGRVLHNIFSIEYKRPEIDYYLESVYRMRVVPHGMRGAKEYTFREKNGKVVDFREVREYQSTAGKTEPSSSWNGSSYGSSSYGGKYSGSGSYSSGYGAGSRKSSSSGRSSSGRYFYDYSDSYDVYDYDDPDDFADDWADDFADLVDGDYDDGYDEAYEYWEENH